MSPSSSPITEARLLGGASACWAGASMGPMLAGNTVGQGWFFAVFASLLVSCLLAASSLLTQSLRRRRRAAPEVSIGPGVRTGWWLHREIVVVGVVGSGLLAVATTSGLYASRQYQPLPSGPVGGVVEVLTRPESTPRSSWRAELRVGGRWRVEAEAWGPAADALSRSRTGDRLDIAARLVEVGERPWLRTRHVVARAVIDEAAPAPARPRPGVRSVVQLIQDRVEAGADHLDRGHRGLYLGLVLGDDRQQPTGQRLRFREAGLTHLLAVSGQNVAFVLAVIRPVLTRLGPQLRLGVTLMVLILFALATGLEPSVLRASAAAAVASWAAWSDRASTGLAVLSVAVGMLVLIDPFLVSSVGFQLSVAASLGILLLGPSVERRLPGPRVFAEPAAVTVAAQLGVSPVLGWHFGLPSLIALPANLAAGWAAGLVMPWGLTGGVVAGLMPTSVGRWLQFPAAGLVWWLDHVAAWSARVPAPRPGGWQLVLIVSLVVALMALNGRRRLAPGVAVVAILVASIPQAPSQPVRCGTGVDWYPAGGSAGRSVLVVAGQARSSSLEDCRSHGISRADVLLVVGSSRAASDMGRAAGELFVVDVTYAPPSHGVRGAYRVVQPITIDHGTGHLRVEPSEDQRELLVNAIAASEVVGVGPGSSDREH